MIQKLRYKFIAIMMSMVSVILLFVFASLVLANERGSVRNTEVFMQQSLFSTLGKERFRMPPDMKPKDVEGRPGRMFPSVIVKIDDGEISQIHQREMEVEKEKLQSWIEYAMENADARGYGDLRQDKVKFYVKNHENQSDLIFADCSFELRQRRNFIFLCLAGFLTANLAFFAVSWFLSGWAVKPVRETWEKQNQFIADASHELKTPLTIMLADTNIVLSHEDSKVGEQKRWIESVREEALSMKKLVEDMLFLAKSDADRIASENTEFDCSDVVTDKVLEFEAVAYENQTELEDEIEKGLTVTGDRNEFGRLVSILLDNAVKYAETDENGTKRVKVLLRRTGRKVCLSVGNTCTDFGEDMRKHVFDRFFRGDAARDRMDGSCGLGLSIALEIVHTMGGNLECSYRDGYAVFEAEI